MELHKRWPWWSMDKDLPCIESGNEPDIAVNLQCRVDELDRETIAACSVELNHFRCFGIKFRREKLRQFQKPISVAQFFGLL